MFHWNKDWDVPIFSYSQGHIDAVINKGGLKWRFTGIYGQSVQDRRKETWELISRLHSISSLPWVLGGDFNEILYDLEKLGGVSRRQRLMQDFRDIIDLFGLIDPRYSGYDFT